MQEHDVWDRPTVLSINPAVLYKVHSRRRDRRLKQTGYLYRFGETLRRGLKFADNISEGTIVLVPVGVKKVILIAFQRF